MAHGEYEGGLHEVADGVFAYLQPHGGWGLSNAGLVAGEGESVLVDTLFDKAHTECMLEAMRRRAPAAAQIQLVINTHANGDHCWGNELVRGARIVASEAAAREMEELEPAALGKLMKAAGLLSTLGPLAPRLGRMARAVGLARLGSLLDAADYVQRAFGTFDFGGIELVLPTETFSGSTQYTVGGRTIELLEVGPAHTKGDVLTFVPEARTVFTGDLLFADAHPLLWEGPTDNWITACDAILERGVDVVVPGHGPLCGPSAVEATRGYVKWLLDQCRQRFEAKMPVEQAALDLELGEYGEWSEPERIAVNVAACYRELGAQGVSYDVVEHFGAMARWERAIAAR